ncbi:MAG: sensor domain-containing diguanylate cyclase [Thermodesulfovibrionales bacterium]|nr:sensor domain-containing diguanylate cyclase [Thermodesulfovibrionales bacterium]
MLGEYGIIGVTIIFCIGTVVFLLVRSSQRAAKPDAQDTACLKEIIARDRQIQKMEIKMNQVAGLNSRYLSFMLKVPTIVQRLNSTSRLHTIILAITEMVKDVVVTKTVELYLYDAADNQLKKLSADGVFNQEQVIVTLGEGIIGSAAKHRFVMMREHFNKMNPHMNGHQNPDSQIWMAVPITFKERLLGVVGVGEIDNPVGNESDLLKMIADIAAVALMNQAILSEAQLKANTDPLTGLNNRNYLYRMAQHYIEQSVQEETALSIFLFDIDNFKDYNDTNGHSAGDQLLIELSQLMRGSTRRESTIVRYGGEEFIIMLPRIDKEGAFIYAERLREKIANHPFRHREKQPMRFVSVSGGIASFPDDGDSIHKVIELADMALYQAKRAGKNLVLPYNPRLSQNTGAEKNPEQ